MRVIGVLRILALLFTLFTTWFFTNAYFNRTNAKAIHLRSWLNYKVKPTKAPLLQNKCNMKRPCPDYTFSFRLISGAANVVGPSMCLEDTILMSGVKNNIGRGLNIALVNDTLKSPPVPSLQLSPRNTHYTHFLRHFHKVEFVAGSNGQLIKTSSFDMYSGDVKLLLDFLNAIGRGTLVLIASYDDPATKLNDEARKLLAELGSSYASKLSFRDNWLFLGGKGVKNKSPFEQYLKNDKETNKYDGWPEVLEMEGCVPKKME